MGRATLLIAIAAILGLGTVLFSSQQTRIATSETTGEYEYAVLARDVARSGLDRGLSETKKDLSAVRSSWDDVEVAGGEYDLAISEVMYGDMEITSTGKVGEAIHTINSNVIFEAPIPATLVVSGPTITVGGDGGGFEISGEDVRMPSRGGGGGFLKPAHGIMVTSGDQVNDVAAQLGDSQITGEGGEGSIVSGADIAWFESLYAEAAGHAQVIHAAAPFLGSYGTYAEPAIVHVAGDFAPTGSFSGAGLLVVEDGDFIVNGNFMWEGVVMIRKAAVATVDVNISGNAKIYGAVVAYEAVPMSTESSCSVVPFDIDGNDVVPQIDYKAQFDVLGAAISAGGEYDMPVTAKLHIGNDESEPWGDWDLALDGNLNTGLTYDWSVPDSLPAGTPLTISSRSWSKVDTLVSGDLNSDWQIAMEQNSETGGGQLQVLRDGDEVPSVSGYLDQSSVEEYIGEYIGADGKVSLAENQVIYLFELGTTDTGSSAFDMQDLVVVVTLSAAEGSCVTDPSVTGNISMDIGGNAGLYYSGEAIAKLGKQLGTIRNATKVVVASQKDTVVD